MERKIDIKLFIIEDNTLYAEALKHFLHTNLERFNYYVSVQIFNTSESCIEALNTNHQSRPDILVLDYFLNSQFKEAMNGLNALFYLKMFNPDVEVIFLSGQNKMEVTVEIVRTGAFDYIVKDEFAFQNVLNSVLKCLKEKRLANRINHVTNRKRVSL